MKKERFFKLDKTLQTWYSNSEFKEDGLEEKVLVYLNKYNIKSYFFLDQSMPSLIKTSTKGNPNCAVRVSEYESIETALNLKGRVNWIWVDIFTKFPLNKVSYLKLRNANFKICLVSQELQNSNQLQINDLKNYLENEKILFDAVCTKFPENWIDKKFFKIRMLFNRSVLSIFA